MALPRYEGIDKLPDIAMSIKAQIRYITLQTLDPNAGLEALYELELIIQYLLQLLAYYQAALVPTGDNYYVLNPVYVDPITPVI